MSSSPRHPRRVPPAAERVRRAREIVALKEAGWTWEAIAERLGVSVSTVRRAAAEHRAAGAPVVVERRDAEFDADAIIVRVLRAHRLSLERLEPLTVKADADSARVGAARALASVGASYLEVAARVGLIGDVGLARYAAELRRAAATILTLADEYGISRDDALAAIDRVPLMLRFAREEVAA